MSDVRPGCAAYLTPGDFWVGGMWLYVARSREPPTPGFKRSENSTKYICDVGYWRRYNTPKYSELPYLMPRVHGSRHRPIRRRLVGRTGDLRWILALRIVLLT
jgi:hypothetical protein